MATEDTTPAAVPGVTRYRKKPVEVEAVRWTGGNLAEVQAFCDPGYFDAVPPEDRDPDPDMTAQVYDKLHGTWVHVHDGQWVIRGIQGELYPCAADVFAATYEPAGEPLTGAQCDGLRRMVTEYQDALSAVRRALDLTAPLDDADREIIAAGREALKVLEGTEKEGGAGYDRDFAGPAL